MPAPTPAAQWKSFLAKYTPAMRAQMKAAHARMRKYLPGAIEMVYDNWNGLVVGFSPTDRPSDAVLSLIALPDHVTLCFLFGKGLPDPDKILNGSGSRVRHRRLVSVADLDKRPIRKLITLAIAQGDPPFDPGIKNKLVIKSVSAKQRPRRPSK